MEFVGPFIGVAHVGIKFDQPPPGSDGVGTGVSPVRVVPNTNSVVHVTYLAMQQRCASSIEAVAVFFLQRLYTAIEVPATIFIGLTLRMLASQFLEHVFFVRDSD